MRSLCLVVIGFLAVPSLAVAQQKPAPKNEPVPGYKRHVIHGFNVLVNKEVLDQDIAGYQKKPLEVLEEELETIVCIMKPDAVRVLRNLVIWVEWDDQEEVTNGASGRTVALYYGGNQLSMLKQGKHPGKAKNITICTLKFLTQLKQPGSKIKQCVILHEMAHAVHDYYVRFDNPHVKAAFQQAVDRGLYDQVQDSNGRLGRAYARTNEFEYFAELSCAYLDRGKWYPFTRDELKAHDPVGHKMMETVWGKPKEALAQAPKPMVERARPAPMAPPASAPTEAGAQELQEKKAASKLKLAQVLHDDGKNADAVESLRELLKVYPTTKAAEQARELLKRWQK